MAEDILTVTPQRMGVEFPRKKIRERGWYERAAERYIRRLARRHVWLWGWGGITVELFRDVAALMWFVRFYWDAVDSPDAQPHRILR